MAAGAGFYDAEGVWQYGETDNIGTLFSDFMNVAPVSISTQFAADRSRLTTLETAVDNPTVYVAASAAARNAHWGTPTTGSTQRALQDLGATTIRTDLGIVERYFANHSGGNPGGAGGGAGWYPIDGSAVFYGTATRSAASGTVYTVGASGFSYVEAFDTLAWHNPSTNPERVTPTVAGLYRLTASVQHAANASGNRRVQIFKNTTGIAGVTGSAVSPGSAVVSSTALIGMNGTTDYFTCTSYQDSGSSLTVDVQMSVEFVRPLSV
jgi:hypothetical protein